jgi:hypothetical protein
MKGSVNRGNLWMRALIGEVAWASIQIKASYFHAPLNRIARTDRVVPPRGAYS